MKSAYDSEKLAEILKIDMALMGDFDLTAFSHKKPALNRRVYTEYTVASGIEDQKNHETDDKESMKASQLMDILQRQNELVYAYVE